MNIIDSLERADMKKEVPKFNVGDTVDVHIKTKEQDKERIQIFTGTVISRKGSGIRKTFTVRRIVQGEGVERIFPLHSPGVVDVVIKKHGKVRRAKLHHLRKKMGKAARIKEKIASESIETEPPIPEKPQVNNKEVSEKKE